MEIKFTEREPAPEQKGRVVMAAKLQKESVFIDSQGNEIDPVTKRIIKRNTDK